MFIAYLRGLFRRRQANAEAEDELQFHVDQETAANIARGLAPDEARRMALRDLGGMTQTREAVRAVRTIWPDVLWQDLRHAARMLRRSPAFATLAILVLALGIGVNTAVFSIVNAVFFRPMPVHAPEELVYLYQVLPARNQVVPTSYRDLEYFRLHNEAFAGLTAHGSGKAMFAADGEADLVQGEWVAANYFDVVGVKPILGRTFRPEEDDVSSTDLAIVISHDLWTRRFEGDRDIIGKRVRLDDKFFSIVGVTGPEFVGLSDPWTPSRYWVTSVQYYGQEYRRMGVGLIGRLKPGVALHQASAIVAVQVQQMWRGRVNPDGTPLHPNPYVVLPASDVRMPFTPTASVVPARLLSAVTIVVAIVLLIAAANIAGVLMARGVTRASELAVRQALGAGTSRLVRQLLTESVLLAAAGGAAGMFVAWMGVRLYQACTPARFVVAVPLDFRVLAFTAAVCLSAGLLVGLAPAAQAQNVDVIAGLGGGAGAGQTRRTRGRLRHGIVIPQIALSVVLLVVAGVHVRTLTLIEAADLGYRVDDLVVMNFSRWDPAGQNRMFPPHDAAAAKAFAERAAEQSRIFSREVFANIRDLPEAAGVALASTLPVNSWSMNPQSIISQESFLAGGAAGMTASSVSISPNYFQTMGMALRQGRDFDDRDALTSPRVAVISDSLARRLWPAGNGIGRSVAFYSPDHPAQRVEWLEVVGIVNEVDPVLHDIGDRPLVYVPVAQQWHASAPYALAWGRGDPSAIIQSLKRAITSADPFAQVSRVQTMRQAVAEILYPRRAAAAILTGAGLVGLLMAAIGLYGVISYSVAQRLREVGIRSALGANRRDIVTLVLREGAFVTVLGAVPGFGLSLLALRLTSNLVGPVPTTDMVTFGSVPVVIAAVILLACYLPARRAARVDPMVVLRGL
jgi:putative ABC transport system permease protein